MAGEVPVESKTNALGRKSNHDANDVAENGTATMAEVLSMAIASVDGNIHEPNMVGGMAVDATLSVGTISGDVDHRELLADMVAESGTETIARRMAAKIEIASEMTKHLIEIKNDDSTIAGEVKAEIVG